MQLALLLVVLFFASLSVGCGAQADVTDYIPPQQTAQQALATALDAWKSGKAPDQIGAAAPAIVVQDDQWQGGQKLSAYEIVGPAAGAGEDQNQRFAVKLTLGSSPPKETTYVIVGKDPIWIFSAEKYQRTSGM